MRMTRSKEQEIVPLDKEIDKTLRALRKEQRGEGTSTSIPLLQVPFEQSSHTTSRAPSLDSCHNPDISDSESSLGDYIDNRFVMDPDDEIPRRNEERNNEHIPNDVNNEMRNRSIREMNSSNVDYNPYGFYNFDANFELKGHLISALPKFYGNAREDPHRHLQNLHMVCSSMKPPGARLDDVLSRAFLFSVDGKAKEWLHMLPQHFATLTWEQLKKAFLEKYFPASRTAKMRKEIYSIQQAVGEGLFEYWSRFLALLARCPHHQIAQSHLVQYFYDGLLDNMKATIDAAAGGSLIDLTSQGAWDLLEKMAANNQQFGARDAAQSCGVGAWSADEILNKLAILSDQVGCMQKTMQAQQVHHVTYRQEPGERLPDTTSNQEIEIPDSNQGDHEDRLRRGP